MGQLLVYSASAGSGKTHSIAGQYILMLFSKPKAYRNILAVTFTNKACEEMKSRIITELAAIINNSPGNRIEEIVKHTGKSSDMVKIMAKQIFTEMLHDYSFFSVSTIDSFFQKILRNFTRETGIQYNYEIELDTENIINLAVDNLLENSNSNPELKKNIISLVDQKMESLSKWDFRKDLKSFLKKVIESDYRSYEVEYNSFFSDKNKVASFKKDINKIEKDFQNSIKQFCDDLSSVLQKHNLNIEDFSGGTTRSIIKRLLKTHKLVISNQDIDSEVHFKDIDLPEKWLKKSELDKEPLKSATNQLIKISILLLQYFEKEYSRYITAIIIKKHLNYAALINEGLQTIHNYLHTEGKFLISEVPVFLSEIARHNSSSFIYEKTGSFYENYLIDEFQDTSGIQWNSFYPLMLESLSSGDENEINILVGDVKQSIYAWRGGDWRLLAYQVKQKFENYYNHISLDDNWRSGETIVNFNNYFFDNAAKVLGNAIKSTYPEKLIEFTGDLIQNSIYNNIKQNVKKDFSSIVKLSIFEKEKDKTLEQSFEYRIVNRMIEQIEELQQNNYKPGDIMILVRTNIQGSRIAQQIIRHAQSPLAKPGIVYDVISSDALFVSSNKAIQLIISCFRYLTNENDKLSFTEAAYLYYLQTIFQSTEVQIYNKTNFSVHLQNILEPLKDSFRQKLLHDLTDIIIEELGLNKKVENVPFLNSFRDIVHEFGLKYPAEVESFLEYWDEKGIKLNLKIPEKQNAINIISIHKSKGLAADFVFVPFCDWDLHKSGDTIWAQTNIEPFNALPVWPVNFDGKTEKSLFREEYYFHKFRQSVESFNMMYVAFTRARKGLFITATDATDNKFAKVSSILRNVIETTEFEKEMQPKISTSDTLNYKEYSIGKIENIEKTLDHDGYFNSYPVYVPLKQIKIKSFFDRDKVDANSQSLVHKGIIYHKIFERITTIDDISSSINDLFAKGQIIKDDVEIYKSEIVKIVSSTQVKSWFDGTYKVSNEAEIVTKNAKLKRPDRIMESGNEIIIVDYKFGHAENSKYVAQTKEYADLLREMGYTNIKIYIWYVLSSYMIEVNHSKDTTEKILL
jgi:ATP-dependent exoDNAse (exonuclease V) beta subunit